MLYKRLDDIRARRARRRDDGYSRNERRDSDDYPDGEGITDQSAVSAYIIPFI